MHIHSIGAEIEIGLILTTYNVATLLIGNDVRCKAIGSGIIKIKMFDVVVRTLSDITQIHDLKKNLISLVTLDSLGYHFSRKNGVMKVYNGA